MNNILLIDDEDLVVKSVSKLLRMRGYSVSVARSGDEALEKLKEIDFNLIVSDVRMPGKDGIETIKEIRKTLAAAGKKHVPEILITGYADREKYDEAMSLEVADYIFKPFDNIDLLRLVEKNIKKIGE